MTTPFEELEYLAEYLPDEGEAVVVRRQFGELICEAYQRERSDRSRDSMGDPELYGRLVHANERLNAQGTLPLWATILLLFWGCVAIHQTFNLGWSGWFYDFGLSLVAGVLCYLWIRKRQREYFDDQVQSMLTWQLKRREIDRYALIGLIRQHAELRTLLDQLSRTSEA